MYDIMKYGITSYGIFIEYNMIRYNKNIYDDTYMCRVLCVCAYVLTSRGRVWAVAHIMNVGMFVERNRFDM